MNTPLRSGPFVLDLGAGSLTRDGQAVPLSGQPLQILALLMAQPGVVITRAALKDAIWPGTARIDTERRLNTAIRALREALGDTAATALLIETVRGKGYRWLGGTAERNTSWPAMRFAAALLGLVVLSSAHSASGSASAAQRELFLVIAARAESDRSSALQALDALIDEAPRYAPARALRAELSVIAWRANEGPVRDAQRAVASARAIVGSSAQLDTLSAELALGGAWDWPRAEHLYRRALASDPGDAEARKGLAWLLINAGRPDAALTELEPLLSREHLDDARRAELGWLLLRMHRPDLALSMCGAGSARHVNLISCRHTAQARLGAVSDARSTAVILMRLVGAETDEIAAVEELSAEAGYRRFLAWRADEFLPAHAPFFQRAQLQAEAGRFDDALATLERSYAAREPALVKLWSTAEFVALHNSPRFQALWREVGPA